MSRFLLWAWLATSLVAVATSGICLLWLASNAPAPSLVLVLAALVLLSFVSAAVAAGRLRADAGRAVA